MEAMICLEFYHGLVHFAAHIENLTEMFLSCTFFGVCTPLYLYTFYRIIQATRALSRKISIIEVSCLVIDMHPCLGRILDVSHNKISRP
jgi:hypothetical protein